MRRRDGSPLWIDDSEPRGKVLQRADLDAQSASLGHYDEAWLQNLLHHHPKIFPIDQIESGFGDLIPLCCELPVLFGGGRSGALDNLFTTRNGGLVLVEAKLWRNPEARRSAIAQALEYAAAVFRMSYRELEIAVSKARVFGKMPAASIFEIVAADSSGIDEEEFTDAVSRNLKRGRAVIAVVGDGIREDIMPLANLMQSHAGHRFTFALVELAVYEIPEAGARLVLPSVLAQTELIERGVVRIEGDGTAGVRVVVESFASASNAPSGGRMSIGEDEFFELLGQRYPSCPELLKSFLAQAEEFGVYAEFLGGLNLKHTSPKGQALNMGTIEKGGIVDTGPSTWFSRKPQGQRYNEAIARLIGGYVKESNSGLESGVRTAAGRMPRLPDLLPLHAQAWLVAMEQYVREFLVESGVPVDSTNPSTALSEIVLEVGGEGGSITLLREREAGGNWRFQVKTNEKTTWGALSEEDRHAIGDYFSQTGYVRSFAEGISLLDRYPWFRLVPLEVNPEFLDAVLREVSKRGGPAEETRWRERLSVPLQ